ncbi:MAG: hypothetical protein ACRCW9_09920 [Cetobacterium sp.]
MIVFKVLFALILILSVIFLIQKFSNIKNCKSNCDHTGILIGILICILGIVHPGYALTIIFCLATLNWIINS